MIFLFLILYMVLKFNCIGNCDNLTFISIVELRNDNLNNIINFYFNDNNYNKFSGVIFIVSKNLVLFEHLNFLKSLILKLYTFNKKFSILGLPYCLLQKILSPLYYTFFKPHFLKLDYLFYNINNYLNFYSTQLISCKTCLMAEICCGLGNLKVNLKPYNFRIHPKYRYLKNKLVKFKNKEISNLYSLYLEQIKNSPLEYTDRDLKFAQVYSKKKELKYSQRFIYYVNFLLKTEYDYELSFLLSVVKNKSFLKKLFDDFYDLKAYSFAYSIAILEDNVLRESYYLYYLTSAGFELFKKRYNLDFNISSNEIYHDTCVDFKDNKISGFKIYTHIKDTSIFLNFLKNNYNFIFPEKLINLTNTFAFAKRYDENSNLIGIKLEFGSNNIELTNRILFDEYGIKIKTKKNIKIFVYAIDLTLLGEVKKITTYLYSH